MMSNIKATAAGHRKITNDQVPRVGNGFFYHLFGVIYFFYKNQRKFCQQNLPKSFTDQFMIICNKYSHNKLLSININQYLKELIPTNKFPAPVHFLIDKCLHDKNSLFYA